MKIFGCLGKIMTWKMNEIKEYDTLSMIYDDLYAPTWPHSQNLEGLITFLKSFPGGNNILEVGIGTGNVIGLLNKAGYKNLTGIDFSPKMLEVAKQKVPNLTAIEQDLRKANYNGFDWVISVGSTYNRISNKDKKELFSKMYNEMDEDALFFVSLRTYEYNHTFEKGKISSGSQMLPTQRATARNKTKVERFALEYEQEWTAHDHFHGKATYLDLKTEKTFEYVYQTYVITENDLLKIITNIGFEHIDTGKPETTSNYYANIWVFKRTEQ